MKLLFTLLSVLLVFTVNGETILKPIHSIKKDSLSLANLQKNLVIHETENHYILRSPLVDFEKNDYFYIQLHPKLRDLTWLKNKGEIVDYKAGEFAILIPKGEKQLLEISSYLHEKGGQCGTLQKLSSMPIEFKKVDPTPLFVNKDANVAAFISEAHFENIIATVKTMVSWKTRYHKDSEGMKAASKLKALYEQVLPSDRTDVAIEFYKHDDTPQDSLIVRILGTENPQDIIVLGSHLDSINNNNNQDAPGADDNASGTATNLEIFRVLMEKGIRPKKTVEIHAYAAEEIGLVGSAEIANDYKSSNKKVSAMIQFDMNGYTEGSNKIYFVSNGTNSTLTSQLGELVDNYLNVPWDKQFLLFGSSDHASWNKRGFPAAFPTENPFAFNGNIHKSSDTVDNMTSHEQTEEFAKLGIAYLMHYAGY